MSRESLEEFYQRVLTDPVLQEPLRVASDRESFVRIGVQLGEEHGYSFTAEELDEAILEAAENEGLESQTVDGAIEQLRINEVVGW
jgi:predicted ribosomally synthesized peptide with nif11-like leader